jgi:hypothetical protein
MDTETAAKQIIEMKNRDLALRDKLLKEGGLSEGYHIDMQALHDRNQRELEKIIEDLGFPTVDLMGIEANQAAWLIIQHSMNYPDFMKKCLRSMTVQAILNLDERCQIAYLTDRIAFFEDRPQLYGTQFDWDNSGEMLPAKYDDLEKVNQRRKDLGWSDLDEQTRNIQRRNREEGLQPPGDLAARKKQFDEWRKEAGWL